MEIRARLQAYFGPEAVDGWALVSQYVTSAPSVAYGGPAGDAVIPNPWVSRAKSPHLELMFRKLLHVQGYSTTLRDFANDLFPVGG